MILVPGTRTVPVASGEMRVVDLATSAKLQAKYGSNRAYQEIGPDGQPRAVFAACDVIGTAPPFVVHSSPVTRIYKDGVGLDNVLVKKTDLSVDQVVRGAVLSGLMVLVQNGCLTDEGESKFLDTYFRMALTALPFNKDLLRLTLVPKADVAGVLRLTAAGNADGGWSLLAWPSDVNIPPPVDVTQALVFKDVIMAPPPVPVATTPKADPEVDVSKLPPLPPSPPDAHAPPDVPKPVDPPARKDSTMVADIVFKNGYAAMTPASQASFADSIDTMSVDGVQNLGPGSQGTLHPGFGSGAPVRDWRSAMTKLGNYILVPRNLDPLADNGQIIFATKDVDVVRGMAKTDGTGNAVVLFAPEEAAIMLPQGGGPSAGAIVVGAVIVIGGIALLASK